MTFEEALKEFDEALMPEVVTKCMRVQCGLFPKLREAIEKQITKKPKIEMKSYPYYYPEVRDDDYRIVCPTCGEEIDEYENKHHCECGQKLDWSEVEE